MVAMPQIGTRVSLKEFEQCIAQPENANRDFEFIEGKIVEVVERVSAEMVAIVNGLLEILTP